MASAKSPRKDGRSAALSKQSTPNRSSSRKDYGSDGVIDNDIFELPGSDWQLLGVLTIVAAAVRLFRIYQPTSVVFDEVQYAPSSLPESLAFDRLLLIFLLQLWRLCL